MAASRARGAAAVAANRTALEQILRDVAATDLALVDHARPAIPPGLRPETRVALAVIVRERGFAVGGRGEAGIIGAATLLVAYLATEPEAVDAFAWLAEHGSAAGQLYAYWALRTVAPDRAAALRPRLLADRRKVTSLEGCVVFDRAIADVVAELDVHSRAARMEAYPEPLAFGADELRDVLHRR